MSALERIVSSAASGWREAQLHPEAAKGGSAEAKTLPAAVAASHVVHAEADNGQIALVWLRIDDSGIYWHDGGTGGFRSYAAFDPAKDFGVVVLMNGASGLANRLGEHIVQRFTGQPAVSLVQL
jgi:D-alanyl-D-alanine-carboxypeptidase/D-alanyl-D-alanine-endopeptidase